MGLSDLVGLTKATAAWIEEHGPHLQDLLRQVLVWACAWSFTRYGYAWYGFSCMPLGVAGAPIVSMGRVMRAFRNGFPSGFCSLVIIAI